MRQLNILGILWIQIVFDYTIIEKWKFKTFEIRMSDRNELNKTWGNYKSFMSREKGWIVLDPDYWIQTTKTRTCIYMQNDHWLYRRRFWPHIVRIFSRDIMLIYYACLNCAVLTINVIHVLCSCTICVPRQNYTCPHDVLAGALNLDDRD